MNDHRNPHGASPALIKEQELENNLIEAEFAWNDAKTLEEKKKALELVDSALGEIEKFHKEKVSKKPNLYFDVDPSLIPTMMQEMEARIIEAEKYVGILGNSVKEVIQILDLESKDYSKLNCIYPIDEVKWDSQSWEEQRG
jgi:hypothetical protein